MFARKRIIKLDTCPRGKLTLGKLGEKAALNYLLKQGMRLIVKNWRTKIGEIDLIMWDNNDLVFIEVKTRHKGHGTDKLIFQNIDHRKRKKLRQLTNVYLMLKYGSRSHPPVRIDVVGVICERNTSLPISIEHLVSAI